MGKRGRRNRAKAKRKLKNSQVKDHVSAQMVGEKNKSKEQPKREPAKQQPERKTQRKWKGNMEFFFESVYQIVTWVCIALSVGFFILFFSQHYWKGMLWSGCALLCSIIVMLALLAQRFFPIFSEAIVETELHGVLVPANDPSPPNPCEGVAAIPPEAVSVFFGSAVAWTTQFPMIVLRVGGLDLLTLKKTRDGLAVSAKIFSADGRIVAGLEDNEFNVNPNNYFKVKRPNRSTLFVYDQQTNAVLNVRYLNPKAIRVSGVFYAPGHRIIIDEERVTPIFGKSTICVANGDIAIDVP